MAHSKQADKRIRQNEEARVHNKGLRSAMKTAIRRVDEALESKDGEAAKVALAQAMTRIDKCAKRNVIHKNTASRKKSLLARRVNGIA